MQEGKRARPLAEIEPELLRESTDEITALISERLPLQSPPGDDWPPIALGFLARSGALLEALTQLVEHNLQGEAQMLLRVVYEHVATFCWLAIDPKIHIAQWREWSDARRLRLHRDAQRFGIEVLTPTEVKSSEGASPPLSLPQLAQEIDEYWSEVSTAFRPYSEGEDDPPSILTFRGFYTAVYRKGSNLIHADMASPDRFATMPLMGHITVHPREKHSENADYPAFSIALVGFLLIVFDYHFSWPGRDVIDRITNALMYYPDD